MHMAKILTFPELVTEHNIARLRQNVLNGKLPPLLIIHFQFSIKDPIAVVTDQLVAACNISRAVMVTNARRLSCAGANKWPGANLIMLPGGSKFVLRFQDRSRFVATLKVC